MKIKMVKIMLPGFGIVILFLAVALRGEQLRQVTASNNYPAPNEIAISTLSWCDREKATNDSRPTQSKPDMSEEEYQKCIAGLTAIPKTKILKPTEPPIPITPFKETRLRRIAGDGILIEGFLGRNSPQVFDQTNTWYEKRGNQFIFVHGGVWRDASPDRSHSAVAVDVSDLAGQWLPGGGIYEAPIQAGELTIVNANGALLTLTTSGGELLFFDVPSRSFIKPSADIVATSAQWKAGPGKIVEKRGSPYNVSYIVNDHWFQENNGKRLSVFSGRTRGEIGQGVVMIVTSLGEPSLSDQPEVYVVPNFTASDTENLRIFTVSRDKVILVAKRGGEYVFDLTAKKFLTPVEAAQLPVDPDLLALETYYDQIREGAINSGRSEIVPTATTTPAYP